MNYLTISEPAVQAQSTYDREYAIVYDDKRIHMRAVRQRGRWFGLDKRQLRRFVREMARAVRGQQVWPAMTWRRRR